MFQRKCRHPRQLSTWFTSNRLEHMSITGCLVNCRFYCVARAQSRLISVNRKVKKCSQPTVSQDDRKNGASTRTADSSDEFGQLAPTPAILDSEYLSDDDDGYDILEKKERLHGMKYYDWIFEKLRHRGGHDRAKQMYEHWMQMKQDDRIGIPKKSHYSMIVATMANSGLTDKAFHLFDEFTKANRFPTQSMITSLFNACGESYDKDEGLSYAHYLRDWLHEKSYVCNTRQYNAMIKAFSRNSDLKMSFTILKEMATLGHQPDDYTFNMLLMGAISDKESGCGHAIRIVRERLKKLSLNEPALRLLLQSIKECRVGSIDHLANLLNVDEMKKLQSSLEKSVSSEIVASTKFSLLNIEDMNHGSDLWPLFQIKSLDTPADRLVLIGGLDGVINLIIKHKVQVTPALLTSLLECLPGDVAVEDKLLSFISTHKFCKVDTGFFNSLIKRRAHRVSFSRGEQCHVQDAFQQMIRFKLQPDIITFGSLVFACRTSRQRREFLNDMQSAGFKVNAPIMNSLINSALHNTSFSHLKYLLKKCLQDQVTLRPATIERIHGKIESTRRILLNDERGIPNPEVPYKYNEQFIQEFDSFVDFFDQNLNNIKIEMPTHERDQFDFEIKKHRRSKLDESMAAILRSNHQNN